ncbi:MULTISPECIES: hypothetical protein [Flammeovirga]|uniref:Rho-binding antiterminator n=1 Tax=Flammeovirga agarivorans TaxID=2726742 RepID=A0A7X8SJ65_9BACT|nr:MULTISPECIES: hypothetical protein [Flammeovirga]NLR91228.1 hypothetical protein [Flammeovirga agarivorans]
MGKSNSDNSYRPISCTVYDHYEIWAMRGTLLAISYNNHSVQTKIHTLKVVDKVEYAVLDNGDTVRLDEIDKIAPVSES